MNSKPNYWHMWIECQCHTEGIMVHLPSGEDLKKDPNETMDLAFFCNSFDHTYSWKQKLRWIWHMLTTGRPYADMVMLDPGSATKLRDVLNEYLNQKFMCQGDV